MTVHVRNIIPRKHAEAVETAQYTAPDVKAVIIDKFTLTNTSLAPASISISLPGVGELPGDENTVLYQRIVSPGETYHCPELVGQVLGAGGFISTVASAADTVVLSASGREIS